MRLTLLFLLILIKTDLFAQKISNLDFELQGTDINLSFNIDSKYSNRGNEEIYKAEVYVKELISGYDDVSTESFFRKKLNLPLSSLDKLKPGPNIIPINVYNYLSEYLGTETLFEFEVSINPTFIPAYIGNIQKLKIGKENSVNINYWENANISFTLSQDGSVVHTDVIGENNLISIPKSLKKGNYNLNLLVSALGKRDTYSRDVQLKKGSPMPILLLLLVGGGVYFGLSGEEKQKANPPLPSPPLPPGG